MSFDNLKNKHATKTIAAVAIYPNACKYSTSDNLAKGNITTPQINQGYTGNVTISGGDALFFSTSNPYLFVGEEIIKVDVINATTLEITARAQLGTQDQAHSAGSARIVHGGEADGSCYGYPARPDGGGCSTQDSFDESVTREFLFTDSQLVTGEIYYNGLQSVSHSPVELKPGREMAKNASTSISILDNTDDDVYAVPYAKNRVSTSTVFRKLLARSPYLRNRRLVTFTGFTENNSFDRANCIEREYVIDDLSIDDNNNVSIRANDPLILAEETKAKAPEASSGRLLTAIDNVSSQIQIKDPVTGEYGNNGDSVVVDIESELIQCTVLDSVAGILTINTRGLAGSEQKDHDINATIQKCIVLTDFNPITEIVNLLQTYTRIKPQFFGDYSSQEAVMVSTSGTSYITKPTSVKKLINEIIRSWAENNISMYFNQVTNLIDIKVEGDFQQQPITLDDSQIKLDRINIKPKYKDQLTRSSIGFAPFDAAKKVDDENSSILFQSINIQTELTGTLEPQFDKPFYSRFLTNSDNDVSIAVGGTARIANGNTRAPTEFIFDIDYENFGNVTGGKIEEGEIINVTTENNIGDDGQPKSENLQIISLKDNYDTATYTVKAILYQDIVDPTSFDFIISENKENYSLSSEFAPTVAGEYTVLIQSNVTIGSTDTAIPAFDSGNHATGVTFKYVVKGSILGASARGGDGVSAGALPGDPEPNVVFGADGFDGGDAFRSRTDCTIDVSQGVIYAAGGGAPSTRALADGLNGILIPSDGGNGSQGYGVGFGGQAGSAFIDGGQEVFGKSGGNGGRSGAGTETQIKAGAWGEDSESALSSGNPGLAGYAIRSLGNSVTIIGDNAATVRGRRDF